MTTVSPVSTYSFFDLEHWLRVKAARLAQGLTRPQDARDTVPHRLTGTLITDTRTGQQYEVVSVKKEWNQGWYFVATLEGSTPSRDCVVENLSCTANAVLDELADFHLHYVTR